jgi:hypothetical protein
MFAPSKNGFAVLFHAFAKTETLIPASTSEQAEVKMRLAFDQTVYMIVVSLQRLKREI